ncbi:hypothetical protein [Yoonia sp.]|uniref:hypothetical protein n=1 Tax=Yoonia sp. TaxID=2212373 RepID=UPI00397650B9
MDTSLNLLPLVTVAAAAAPALPRAVTTKVHAVQQAENSATLPANKPFVAQVVTARLSGSAYPENPSEIAPPDRTLRPYDIPMLPYDTSETRAEKPAADALTQAEGSIPKDS